MEIKSAEFLKSHSDEMLKSVNKTRKTIIITQNDEAKAVLQDFKSYQELQNALLLLKFISKGEKDYREGKLLSHEVVKTQMTKKLKTMQEENAERIRD